MVVTVGARWRHISEAAGERAGPIGICHDYVSRTDRARRGHCADAGGAVDDYTRCIPAPILTVLPEINPVPVICTAVPPAVGPLTGEMPVTVGVGNVYK